MVVNLRKIGKFISTEYKTIYACAANISSTKLNMPIDISANRWSTKLCHGISANGSSAKFTMPMQSNKSIEHELNYGKVFEQADQAQNNKVPTSSSIQTKLAASRNYKSLVHLARCMIEL